MRGIRAAAIGLAAVASMAGCAQATAPAPASQASQQPPALPSPIASTPSATLEPSPSANPIQSALTATTARGTAAISLEVLTAASGVERTLTGEGIVDFPRGAWDIRWSSLDGDSREVRTEDGFYVEVQPDSWLAVEPGRPTPTSEAGDVLRGLSQLTDAEPVGEESLLGTSTIRYRGTLPAADDGSGLGLNDDERALLRAEPGAMEEVTVWIDSAGRIVQVMRTLRDAGPVAATSIVRLTAFGIAAPIDPPASIAATAA
ncbi:MAG: hypothetical protein KGP12_03495 [Actinomycetales bacterium]|nr:hypothetical protein [Actinomycetales bacterium]